VDHFLKQLQKTKENVRLDQARKDDVRARLVQFMDANPVKKKNSFASFFYSFKMIPVAVFVLLLVLVLGGTSFAAESALPGDFLYPVKVQVNEKIRTAFTVSPEAKTEWASEQAERRLAEAEALAAQNRLDASNQAKLEASFESNAQEVRNGIVRLEASGNATASVQAASRLDDDIKHGIKLKLSVPRLEIESENTIEIEGQHGKSKSDEGEKHGNEGKEEHGLNLGL
jgi:Domain of unknown function (DUF5667)